MAPPLFLERGSRGKLVRAFQAGLNVRRQLHPLHDVLPPLAEDAVMDAARRIRNGEPLRWVEEMGRG